jgi:hypothetical protein
MAFDRFNWWKRGVKVTKPLTKVPYGSDKPLVYHQILHGDFRPSPYWEMAKQEEKYLEEEVKKYRKANPHVKEDSVRDFRYTRARIYTKRANKLRESHQEYEVARLDMLRKGLKDAFGKDYWDLALDLVHHTKNEDEMDLYLIYEALVKEKKTRKI